MASVILYSLLLLGCLALSFVLSGMEAGVLALSRFRVRRQMRVGVRKAELLNRYLESPENFLWTILVGNTLAAFAAFSFFVIGLYNALDGRLWLVLPSLAVLVFLFYLLCDLLPKMLFRQFPNRLCLVLASPFRLLHLALAPLVAVLTWSSNGLLRVTRGQRFKGHIFSNRRQARLAIQESAKILSSEERAMVHRVLDLQDLTVRSITIPLNRVVGVTRRTKVADMLEICRQQPLRRFPVWDGGGPGRRTLGIVSLSTLLYAEEIDSTDSVARYSKPPLQLREDVRLEDALRRMQRTRQRMAVVLGFDRRELGIVNLRDILQSIFGEVTL